MTRFFITTLLISCCFLPGCKPKQVADAVDVAMNAKAVNDAKNTFAEAEKLDKLMKQKPADMLTNPKFKEQFAELKKRTGISNPKELVEYLKKHPEAVKSVLKKETARDILSQFQEWAENFTDLSIKGGERFMKQYPTAEQIPGDPSENKSQAQELRYLFPHMKIILTWKQGVFEEAAIDFALSGYWYREFGLAMEKPGEGEPAPEVELPDPFLSWFQWLKVREESSLESLKQELDKSLEPDEELVSGLKSLFPNVSGHSWKNVKLIVMMIHQSKKKVEPGILTMSLIHNVTSAAQKQPATSPK